MKLRGIPALIFTIAFLIFSFGYSHRVDWSFLDIDWSFLERYNHHSSTHSIMHKGVKWEIKGKKEFGHPEPIFDVIRKTDGKEELVHSFNVYDIDSLDVYINEIGGINLSYKGSTANGVKDITTTIDADGSLVK